jgi:ATP synthase protein I
MSTSSPRNNPGGNHRGDGEESERLREAVRLRESRRALGESDGERSLWRNLQMIGALGWLIVAPTLLGVLAGRWLDARFGSGIFFTGALIMLGAAGGCWLAWRRITSE